MAAANGVPSTGGALQQVCRTPVGGLLRRVQCDDLGLWADGLRQDIHDGHWQPARHSRRAGWDRASSCEVRGLWTRIASLRRPFVVVDLGFDLDLVALFVSVLP